MDAVVDMFKADLVHGQARVAELGRRSLQAARPDLAARLNGSAHAAYLDPLVLGYFGAGAEPGVTLDQLTVGRMARAARPELLPVRTGPDGAAELPGLGVLRTHRRSAELLLAPDLTVSERGRPVSSRLDPAPVVGDSSVLMDDWISPALRFVVGPRSTTAFDPARVRADLARAEGMVRRAQPEFHRAMIATTRRIVVFDDPSMNSLAAPRAHGSVFLNLAHGRGPIHHLEDLLHQCGHVAFSAMTMDTGRVLAVDPDTELLPGDGGAGTGLGGTGEGGEPRTAYVVLHALVTERWMASGLLACLRTEELTPLERHEARGRLAYVLRRYALDLVDLVDADVVTPDGLALLRQLLADLRSLHAAAEPQTRGLSLAGQPYNFDLDVFLERNGGPVAPVPW